MKAEVITLQNIKNYGSMLQAFATQELLKEVGFVPEILDYTRKDALFWNHIKGYSKNDGLIAKVVKSCILLPTEIRYKILWNSFKKKHINSSDAHYSSLEELNRTPPCADIYCSGSDQVWNSGWNGGVLPEFFLGFVKNKKKYALASSIGSFEFSDNDKDKIAELLSEFEMISVREKSAVGALEQIGIKEACSILDPTLTVDSVFWSQLKRKSKEKKDFLLIYQLGKNSELDKWAEIIAKRKGLSIVRIGIRYDYIIRKGKPYLIPSFEQFITLFSNASCVITDSFHASCFSLNFSKDFWCVLPKEYHGRITDLLDTFEIPNRIINDDYNLQMIDEHINYEKVNKILDKERSRAKSFYTKVFKDATESE